MFKIPLTLYIDIDLKSFPVFILYFSTKLWLINILISPKSTSVCINKSFNILVVSSKINKYKEVTWASKVLIVDTEEISSLT